MNSSDVRKKYLDFFVARGHVAIPSASLIPDGDTTTLFTGSGMQPLLPYLLGKPHTAGKRITDSQKSFRAEDIDEVGDNRHTTFFEMLGNWSFGDYWKKEQLGWFFEFLTDTEKGIGLKPERLYVTVFSGDEQYGIPADHDSVLIWKDLFASRGVPDVRAVELLTEEQASTLGMQGGRIFYYGAKKNWWSRSGTPDKMPAREPGGPDSEVFYKFESVTHDTRFGAHCHPNCDCGCFMEIGNSVFMEYIKTEAGTFEKLSQRNVDFGGGLERITAASNDDPDIFHIDIFAPILDVLDRKFSTSRPLWSKRVIADHTRSAIFLIADGVLPSNKDQGYVLRRLLRRAMPHILEFQFFDPVISNDKSDHIMKFRGLGSIAGIFIDEYSKSKEFAYLAEKKKEILEIIEKENDKFDIVYEKGKKILQKLIDRTIADNMDILSGKDIFELITSHGFSIEWIKDQAEKLHGLKLDIDGFTKMFDEHRALSRASAQKKFGGHGLLLDTGELKAANQEELQIVTRLHTTTHLIHQALRRVLGDSVHQAGSDITKERARFDFTYDRKLTNDEICQVEDIVNEVIRQDMPVQKIVLPKADAEKTGALFFFKEKYPDPVNIYFVGHSIEDAFSKEFCGGPHVAHTGEIGHVRIAKEEAVASGVRRIRVVLS